jgi:hypothetical protein
MSAPVPPRRPAHRARRPLTGGALVVPLLLAVALAPYWPPAASPAGAQAPSSPTATGTAQAVTPTPGPRPPQNDPAGPPSAYTLSRSDQLFVTKTQQWPDVPGLSVSGSTYTFSPDVSRVSNATPFVDTGVPAGDPSWPLLPVRGRFTDALHEQALVLSQANDCVGPETCTYTLLLGQAAGGTTGVPVWLRRVQGAGGGSPVAVAAGDLDGRISAQGFPNDEVAVASLNPDGTLRVDVVDYNVAPGDAVDTAPAVALPAVGTPATGPGSLGVAVGDFDSDGQNEIAVLWQGAGCAVAAPGCLSVPHLTVLRYTNTGRARSLAALSADVPLPATLLAGSPATDMGFQMVVGDFDGQGTDQLAVSYVVQDATFAVLGFARGDETFTVNRFVAVTDEFTGKAYCPASGCSSGAARLPPQLTSGLFWYDEASGHGLNRRQLAMTALRNWTPGSGGELVLQLYDVGFDASTCVQSQTPQSQPPCPLAVNNLLAQGGINLVSFGDSAGSTVVPTVSLAAGSFQGLILNPSSPAQVPWFVAVGLSGLVGSTSQASATVNYYRIDAGTNPGLYGLTQLFQSDQEPSATAPRLLAYDPAGDSLVLGAPLVFRVGGNYVPSYILQDPPKHLDWIPPQDPSETHGSWLNVDRSDSYNLTVAQTTTEDYSSQTTTGTDWTIGGSVSVNVTASTQEGLGKIANAGGGLDVSTEVGGQYDTNHSSYTQDSSSYSKSFTGATDDDDLIYGAERTWSVYRYPILGRPLKDRQGNLILGPNGQPQYGFYEVTLPGSTAEFGPTGGRNFGDWYQPVHQNGNALSYPPLGGNNLVPLDPGVLGPALPLAGAPPPAQLPQPLLNQGYGVGATGTSIQLAIAGTTGSGNTTSTSGTLSESADIDAGVSGGLYLGVAEVSACADVDVKFNNSNSWSALSTSSSSTTSSNTFTVIQNEAAQANFAYDAATAYYVDPAGVYRAAHAVNLLASTEGGAEWKQYYGGRPDPALNLPNRMVMTYSQVDKANDIPNFNNSDSRQLIRGFFALHPDAALGGGSGPLTAGAPFANPTDGDTVQLQVRVHNYSLDTAATRVPVEFWAVARDASDEHNVGQLTRLGTVTLDSIPPLGWVPANFLWGTTGLAPQGAQLYRIFVIVARNDPSLGAADPWNNVAHAWADRYNDPATVDGTPPGCGLLHCARLTDPFTGKDEILEAGQNKQGFGEVTIFPRSPAPAPLAAAGGAAQASRAPQAATPLRFGSGGLSVTNPSAGAAARTGLNATAGAAAAPTTDSVQEVRVHLAAAAATALGNSFCNDNNNSATLAVYEGDPAQGGELVGMKRVRGLAGSGPAGRWVTLPWTPRTAGRRQLVARLYGAGDDPRASPAQLTADVDVSPAAEPPATLQRLQDVVGVVWLPADLRAALAARVQTANAAVLAGDQPGARAALTALAAQATAAQGSTVSGMSVSRLTGLVDALLAQPAIAAFCLPASAAPAAPAGVPGPTATPAAGALPPCAPGAGAGTVTPTATGTPGTATPTPAGTPATATATTTPAASGTPGTPAAGGTGSPTPPASGSPTPGTGSPTPVRTATPPPTVVPPPLPPPLAPPTVVPPPLAPPTTAPAAPAGPPRASDGQHLGLQPAAVQAAFRATHGDAAEARWAAEHEAELNRPTP